MRWYPKGYGGTRRDPDQVKRDGWHDEGVLAVSVDDDRLTWPERELERVAFNRFCTQLLESS